MKTKAEIIDDITRKEGGDKFTVAQPDRPCFNPQQFTCPCRGNGADRM
jgi:hypothetical protein